MIAPRWLGIAARRFYKVGSLYRVPFGSFRGMRLKYHGEMQLSMMLGIYDLAVHRWITAALNGVPQWTDAAVACDLGANSGVYSLWLSRLVPRGKVYAFEPIPALAGRLTETLSINSVNNVQVVNAAVGDAIGSAQFVVRGVDGTASSLQGLMPDRDAGEYLDVRVTTLDDMFADLATMPAFLKIDVEGALPAVLRGAKRLLSTKRPTLYVELHNPEEDRAIGELMTAYGYEALRWQNRAWVIDCTKTYPAPNGVWGHLLVVPREDRAAVEAALKARSY